MKLRSLFVVLLSAVLAGQALASAPVRTAPIDDPIRGHVTGRVGRIQILPEKRAEKPAGDLKPVPMPPGTRGPKGPATR